MPRSKTLPPAAECATASFHQRLQHWYNTHGRRDLPWRNTRDAYAIYISEIMLQQTQVKTVLERFYTPFLTRFPSLQALANAPQQEVLSAWQGLGYYSRARNLHQAAQSCAGRLPQTIDGLIALPGIGKNTAHAIAAFAYHQPVAVMEANVKRVLSRIFALKNPAADELWDKAQQLLNTKNPFDYNQAMMDIGSLVCTKRAPQCEICPANALCEGKAVPQNFPQAKGKKKVPVRKQVIVVQKNGRGQFFATPRQSKFLGGLYHFAEQPAPPAKAVFLGHIRQQYSHFTLEADIYLQPSHKSGRHWYSLGKLKQLPMSMAEKKILQLLG